MILGWRRPGKVGGCRNQKIILDSSAVEQPAVNRWVVGSNPTRGGNYLGSVVKRLRHGPFTAVTRVRFPVGSVKYADVAQLAEQLTCNQQVNGSSPFIGFIWLGSRVAKGGRL